MTIDAESKEQIRRYISQHAQTKEIVDEVDLFQTKIVNSLFVIELMVFLEETFSIRILSSDFDMRHFRSIQSICEFIAMKRQDVNDAV